MWIIIEILIVILFFYFINKWLKIITIIPYKKLYQVEVRKNNLVYKIGAKKAYTGYVVQNYRDGKPMVQEKFEKGLKNEQQLYFFEDGKIQRIETYQKGQLHGEYKIYYSTGNLKLERLYHYGISSGELRKYYSNGAIKLRAPFVNGLLYGTVGSFNENGELIMKVEFRNGEPLGSPLLCNFGSFRSVTITLSGKIFISFTKSSIILLSIFSLNLFFRL